MVLDINHNDLESSQGKKRSIGCWLSGCSESMSSGYGQGLEMGVYFQSDYLICFLALSPLITLPRRLILSRKESPLSVVPTAALLDFVNGV